MPCRYMRLFQHSLLPYGLYNYSSVFGSLVLTCGSPSRPCPYMQLSRHFSPLGFVRGDFGCAEGFCLRFVVRSIGFSIWDPAFNLPVFNFLVSLCGPCGAAEDLLFSTLFRCFRVWSAVSDVVAPTSPVRYACMPFMFFW